MSAIILMLIAAVTVAAQEFDLEKAAQLVPRRGLERLLEFRQKNLNIPFRQDVYYCTGQPPTDARYCGERGRIYTTRTITLKDHDYAVYINMKQPSTETRFYVINMRTAEVEVLHVAHGLGSGESAIPARFSNRKDSKQTSLGFYLTGETYNSGNHGTALRLYGLERSNDRAFIRDIVFHGAKYAEADFFKRIDPRTGKPMDRLGLSWGCPAVDREAAKRLIPLLKDGALIFIDHEDLLEQALTGNEAALVNAPPSNTGGIRPNAQPGSTERNKKSRR